MATVNSPEVFEQEDLLTKEKPVELVGAPKQLNLRKKIPVRLWIVAMVFLTTYVQYTTRVNMSMSIISMTGGGKLKKTPYCILLEQQQIQKEMSKLDPNYNTTKPPSTLPDHGPRYEWDENVQGMILGSYFWGYIFTSLPGGMVSEMFGPYKVIFWCELLSGIVNALSVPAAHVHYSVLIVCRILVGVLGGFVYPALQVLIAKWAPPAEKGKFVAGLMGNTLATCVTWPLVGAVTSTFGWDWGFYVVSLQIIVFCLIFYCVASDSPETHRFITPEEVAYIKDAQGGAVSKKKRTPPYSKICTNVPFWMLTILHFGNLWGLYLQVTGVPKFLSEVIGFDLKKAGFLAALPHLARLFMGIGFGALGDYLIVKGVSAKVERKGFVLCSHIIPGLLLIAIAFVGCNWVPIVIFLTFSMSINGAAVMTNLQNPQDLAPNFAGTIFGIISFIGGMTGFIVPAINGVFISNHNGTEEWGYIFILGGVVYITCGLIFICFGSVKEQKWNRTADEEEK